MRGAPRLPLPGRAAFVDSSVIINAFDTAASPARREPALELLESGFEGKASLAVSNQVLGEVFHAFTKLARGRSPIRDARSLLEDFLASRRWSKLEYTSSTMREAARVNEEFRIGSWDAVIVATMREHNLSKIYTENVDDFSSVPGLEVVNPTDEPAAD